LIAVRSDRLTTKSPGRSKPDPIAVAGMDHPHARRATRRCRRGSVLWSRQRIESGRPRKNHAPENRRDQLMFPVVMCTRAGLVSEHTADRRPAPHLTRPHSPHRGLSPDTWPTGRMVIPRRHRWRVARQAWSGVWVCRANRNWARAQNCGTQVGSAPGERNIIAARLALPDIQALRGYIRVVMRLGAASCFRFRVPGSGA